MNIIIKKHFVNIKCSYILNIVLPLASLYQSSFKVNYFNYYHCPLSKPHSHNLDSVSLLVFIAKKILLRYDFLPLFYCLPALEHMLYKDMDLSVLYTDVNKY